LILRFQHSPTWNNIINNINSGALGTVTMVDGGMSAVINSETCPTSEEGGLAFVVGYASWVEGEGSVGWSEYINALDGEGLKGFWINYDC